MDSILYFVIAMFLLLLIGLVYCLITNILKKAHTKPYHFYQNQILLALQQNAAKSIIICQYIEGMSNFTPNALYIICANEKQLKFTELENKSKTFNIDFSDLKSFHQTVETKNIENYIGGANFASESIVFEYCLIKYKTPFGIIDNIFQYRPLNKIYYDMFNNVAIKECNIFDYVNSHISKQ